MPLNGKLNKTEISALENSYLSFEGALPGFLLWNADEILQTRGGGQGLKLYDGLYRDPHVQAVFNRLGGDVTSRDWIVAPGGDKKIDKKAADIVREQMQNLNAFDLSETEENHSSVNGFDQLTRTMIVSGRLNGYVCAEVLWTTRDNMIVANEIRVRDPRQFGFMRGQHGYVLRHLTKANPFIGIPVPPKTHLVWSYGALDGSPYGRALGEALFWLVFFKRNVLKFDLKFLENFASPKVVGKYPRGSQGEQIATLNAAIHAIANETGITVPETMMLEYLQASASGTVDAYEKALKYFDEQISEVVLGETGSVNQSGSGGSRARDQVGERSGEKISKAIADSLSSTFNRLARWISVYNVPDAAPPTIYRDFAQGENLDSRIAIDKTLFDLGYRLNPERVADTYGNNYEQAGGDDKEPALISSLGVGGVQALTGLLTQAATGQLPKENAIAVLVSVFGIAEDAAAKMVPDAPEETPQTNPLDQLFGGQGNEEEQPPDPNAEFAETKQKDAAELIADKVRPLVQDAIAPWLDQVRNFVEQSASLEEIRDGLVDLFPDLDDAEFAEAMESAIVLADLAGREEVLQDDADVAFAEAIEAALNGTLDFAAKKGTAAAGKKPNCNPAKSHFCQSATGKGSCVPLSKVCKYPPTGVAKQASGYKGKKASSTASAPTTVPKTTQPATPLVKTNEPELKAKRDELVKRIGQQRVEEAEANVKKLLEDSGVYMKVPNSEVMAFVLGDKFKTAHELGGRPGAPPPGSADDYLGARAWVEKKVLGIDDNTLGSDRPKYGYLGSKDLNSQEHLDVSGAYGNITVEFKPEVRDRATFTGADSFKSGIASKIDDPNAASLAAITSRGHDKSINVTDHADQIINAAKAKNLSELAEGLAPTGNAYLEAQIHGQLTAKDVKALHFRPTGYHDSPSPEVVQFAKDQGIDIYINGKLTPHDKIKPQVVPVKIKEFSDAITSGNVSKLNGVIARLENDLKTQQTKAPDKFGGSDPLQNLLAYKAGFGDKPKAVDAAEFDKLVASNHIVMYRGVSDGGGKTGTSIQQQFIDGEYHSGHGVYGHGNYFAHGANTRNGVIQKGSGSDALDKEAKGVAINYSQRGFAKGSRIVRTALSEDAKIATSAQVIQLQRNFAQKIDAEIEVRKKQALDAAPKLTQKGADTINKDIDAMDNSFKLTMGKETTEKVFTGTFGERDLNTATYVLDGKNKRPSFLSSEIRKYVGPDRIKYQLTDPSGRPSVHLTDTSIELKLYMQNKYKDKIPANYKNNGLNWIKFDSVDAMNAAIEESVKELVIIKKHGTLEKRKAGDATAKGYTDAQSAGKVLESLKDKLGISSDDKDKQQVNSKFAIAMGIDAVSVSSTTGKGNESSQYINVLNRSKLIVDKTIYTPAAIKKVKRP